MVNRYGLNNLKKNMNIKSYAGGSIGAMVKKYKKSNRVNGANIITGRANMGTMSYSIAPINAS